MNELVIFGTGGHAREVHQLVEDTVAAGASWNFLGFLDENESRHGLEVHGHPVLGGAQWLDRYPKCRVVVAIGNTKAKNRVVRHIQSNFRNLFASVIHPTAWIAGRSQIGKGCTICAGALINADTQIDDHVIVNVGTSISHDSRIGQFSTLAPHVTVCGTVTIGQGVDLGAGSTVIQGLNIGEWSIIGAGSVIIRNIPPNITAVGIPAKKIKERPAGWHED